VFERYSEKARRVVFFARYEASQLGGRAIEPEHLLLAIMREDTTLAESVLSGGAAGLSDMREMIETAARSGPKVGASVDLPLSPSAKRAMNIAADESKKAGDERIEPRHLLLGLLLEESSTASQLLRQNGVTADLILKESALLPALPPKKQSEAARMLAQLSALIEVLIKQGVFSRQDLAEELANRYILPDLHATLNSLLAMLVRKGVINEGDRRQIVGVSEP
jgi:ATP-dependent Clp protease ATP-binding subunit ClpC